MADRDEGLIRFLMRERHGSPFEHNAFRFHIKCPIFVAREWMRHRIGSFNEWSAPLLAARARVLRARPPRTCGRRSASRARTRSSRWTPELAEQTREAQRAVYEQAYRPTRSCSSRASPRRSRATCCRSAIYTQFYWTVNARSLMNFLSLRNAETAQREIRRYAEAVEQLSRDGCRSRTPRSWPTSAARPKKALRAIPMGDAGSPVCGDMRCMQSVPPGAVHPSATRSAQPRISSQIRRFAMLWLAAALVVLIAMDRRSIRQPSYRDTAASRARAARPAQTRRRPRLGSSSGR